jgi:hypothetical protein
MEYGIGSRSIFSKIPDLQFNKKNTKNNKNPISMIALISNLKKPFFLTSGILKLSLFTKLGTFVVSLFILLNGSNLFY